MCRLGKEKRNDLMSPGLRGLPFGWLPSLSPSLPDGTPAVVFIGYELRMPLEKRSQHRTTYTGVVSFKSGIRRLIHRSLF